MKKNTIAIVLGISLLICTSCSQKHEEAASTSIPSKSKIENKVDAFGTVKAKNIKNIIIDFPSRVTKIAVQEGSHVKKGDVLVSLDLSEYKKQIRDKELELDTAKTDLSKAQTDIGWMKSDISSRQKYLNTNTDPELKKLTSDLEYANNSYKKGLEDLKKERSLLDSGVIPQSDYDAFEDTVTGKKKAVEDAKKALEIAKHNKQKEIDGLQSEMDQKVNRAKGIDSVQLLKEKIDGIESDIKLMKDKLNKDYIKENNIVSDTDNGVVYDIGYVQGDYTDVSKKMLSIMDTDSIYINADVEEEFIKNVKVGANVTIIPTADKSRKYKGKVVKISGNAVEKKDETSVSVEIAIEDKDEFLVPNFNVDIKIEI
jgi:multidrug resistance efflux pump